MFYFCFGEDIFVAKKTATKARLGFWRPACNINAKRRKVEGERVKRSDSLSEEEIRQIKEFYLRDDISRILPGKKD